jgi:hypothetical protein
MVGWHVSVQPKLTLCECDNGKENHFLESQLPENIILSKQTIPGPLQGIFEKGLWGGGGATWQTPSPIIVQLLQMVWQNQFQKTRPHPSHPKTTIVFQRGALWQILAMYFAWQFEVLGDQVMGSNTLF